MKKNRKSAFLAGTTLSCGLVFASTCSAQVIVNSGRLDAPVSYGTVIQQPIPTTLTKHLGNGPIDMNNLSADILNCEVCRQRLGLPPLNSATVQAVPTNQVISPNGSTTVTPLIVASPLNNVADAIPPKSASSQMPGASPVRMLGSSGLISSGTAEQMASQGLIVQEFKPPQVPQDAIRLGDIPPEVRQQFLRSLDLPFGAKVMSAEIKVQNSSEGSDINTSESVQAEAVSKPISQSPLQKETALPTPTSQSPTTQTPAASVQPDYVKEQLQLKQTVEQLQKQLEEQTAAFTKKQVESEQASSEKINSLIAEREEVESERSKLKNQLVQTQAEWQNQLNKANAAQKEALTLLETRTAEVTELQLQLKSQQEANAQLESRLNDSKINEKRESKKKKEPNKGKKKKP